MTDPRKKQHTVVGITIDTNEENMYKGELSGETDKHSKFTEHVVRERLN